MSERQTPRPHLVLTVLFALWAMAFAYSFVAFVVTAPEGSGFTRGSNRITTFLGWQGIAGLLALCVFGVGRSWMPGSSVRRLSLLPLGLAGVLVAGVLGVIGWAVVTG